MSTPLSHAILHRAAQGAGGASKLSVDRVVLSGSRAPAALLAMDDSGPPWSAEDLILTLDFHAPDIESTLPRARIRCREIAARFGLKHVFDLDAGVGSMTVLDWGLVAPGQLVAGCGQCLGVVGGVGAFGLRLEQQALTGVMLEGSVGLAVPDAVEVNVLGRLPRHLGPWDTARAVSLLVGDALTGSVVEFSGETESWSVAFRAAVCGLMAEMGAVAALVAPDSAIAGHFEELGLEAPAPEPVETGTTYSAVFDLDAAAIQSRVGAAYGGESSPLGDQGGEPVHGAFVGSCYGGHLEDLAVAAEILRKAGRVHESVRLIVSPTTLEVARAALNAGYYEVFLRAGAMITAPGLGAGLLGGGAILGEGEHLASTAEYHRAVDPGQGSPQVTVMSAAAAAAAAVTGCVTDPAEFIS